MVTYNIIEITDRSSATKRPVLVKKYSSASKQIMNLLSDGQKVEVQKIVSYPTQILQPESQLLPASRRLMVLKTSTNIHSCPLSFCLTLTWVVDVAHEVCPHVLHCGS